MYVIMHGTRLLTVFGSKPVLNRCGPEIDNKSCWVMIYGALRGAIGLALVLLVHNDEELTGKNNDDFKEEILFQVCFTIALTLLINATTIDKLLQYLGMTDLTKPEKMSIRDADNILSREIAHEIEGMRLDPRYSFVHFDQAEERMPNTLQENYSKASQEP
eukprot:UN03281